MKSEFVVLLLSLLVSLLVLGCAAQPPAANGGGKTNASPAVSDAAGSPPAPVPGAKTVTVEISSLSFQPPSITVDAGTTVTWLNKDSVPHSATGDNGAFDTDTFANGESRSYTFTSAGTYAYHCVIHTRMRGTVTVR